MTQSANKEFLKIYQEFEGSRCIACDCKVDPDDFIANDGFCNECWLIKYIDGEIYDDGEE